MAAVTFPKATTSSSAGRIRFAEISPYDVASSGTAVGSINIRERITLSGTSSSGTAGELDFTAHIPLASTVDVASSGTAVGSITFHRLAEARLPGPGFRKDRYLCDPLIIRAIARAGGAQCDLTERSTWSFDLLRSGIPSLVLDVDRCDCRQAFTPWTDLIEFLWDADNPMMRFVYVDSEPATTLRILAQGLSAQLSYRRNTDRTLEFFGTGPEIFRTGYQNANDISTMFVAPTIVAADAGFEQPNLEASIGPRITYLNLTDSMSPYVTYAEHSASLEVAAAGNELRGLPIRADWIAGSDIPEPEVDSSLLTTEVAINYTESLLDSVTWPPNDYPDPRASARVQGAAFNFPEIRTSEHAYDMAKRLWTMLSVPQLVLPEVEFDLRKVQWDWIIPGRSSLSHLPGTEGRLFNLDRVRIDGIGNRIVKAVGTYDQGDIEAIRSRQSG